MEDSDKQDNVSKVTEWWENAIIRFTYDKMPNSPKAWLQAFWNTDIFIHKIPLLKMVLLIVIIIQFL